MLEQAWDPSFCYGILHKKPWTITTERQYVDSRSPEERALLDDEVELGECSTPLLFDRFRRDVYNLASCFLHSDEWDIEDRVEKQLEYMEDQRISVVSL
jgi:hypothetical protein